MATLNSLTTKNSRYVFGGNTSIKDGFLGWWERQSLDALRNFAEIEWTITPEFQHRAYMISNEFYGTPSLGWLILEYNNIVDDIEQLTTGSTIRIPDPERVKLGLASLRTAGQ